MRNSIYFVLVAILCACNIQPKQPIQDAPLISDTFWDSDSVFHKIEANQKWVLWSDNHILLARDLQINSPNLFINPAFPDSVFPYFTDEQAKKIQEFKFILDSDETTPAFLTSLKRNQWVNFRTQKLDDILYQIRVIGTIFGKSKEAQHLADSLAIVKKAIKRSIPKDRNLKAVMVLNNQPLLVAGKGSYLQEMMELCGLKNIFDDQNEASAEVSIEQIIQRQPDVLFAISEDPQFSEHFMNLSSQTYKIPAVQNERSFQLSPINFLNSDKECFLGLYQMARTVYPTAIEPYDSLTIHYKSR